MFIRRPAAKYDFVLAMWRARGKIPQSRLGPPMNIDTQDSMLLLALIYLSVFCGTWTKRPATEQSNMESALAARVVA